MELLERANNGKNERKWCRLTVDDRYNKFKINDRAPLHAGCYEGKYGLPIIKGVK